MSTFYQMIEETLAEVSNYVRSQESLTYITANMDETTTDIEVDDTNEISKGTVEVGSELVYVTKIDRQSGILKLLPNGRGWRGTQKVAWPSGTTVRNNPTFPRSQIARALNETVTGVDLYAISDYTFNFDGVTGAYELPADFIDVTGVSADNVGPSEIWSVMRNFRIDRNYLMDDGTSGSAIVLHPPVPMPGRDVRVQYVKHGEQMVDLEMEFSEATGLPASCEDVIRLGATWRLVSTIDPGKVTANTPSADVMDTPIQAGQPTSVARYLYQVFNIRLAEERAKQQSKYFRAIQHSG